MMTYHKLFVNISPTRSQNSSPTRSLNISPNFISKTSEYFTNKISEYFTKFHQHNLWIFHQQDHHNTKQPSSNETNSDYEQNRLLQSLNNLFRKFSKSLSPNHAILIPFLQNCCTKTLMLSSLQSPASSTFHWLLVLYHQTSKLLLSNSCSKKPHTIKMYWKTTVQSQTCHFCLKFLKRSFYANFSHTSKKTTSAILSSQPTAPDTAPRLHSYAL